MYEDFGEIRADVTDRLTHAVTDRSVPMHTPVVATADADARVMVLRGVERGGWLLRFHTDARAPKVAAILRDPRIAVLGYDKQAKIQLRMRGRARIERDGARVEEAWAESTNFARRCYLGDAPGQSSPVPTSGLPEAFETSEPADAQLVPARHETGSKRGALPSRAPLAFWIVPRSSAIWSQRTPPTSSPRAVPSG